MASWGGVWNRLRAMGHALFYASMAGVCGAFIVMGVITVAGRDRIWYQHRPWHRDATDRQYQGRHSESAGDD